MKQPFAARGPEQPPTAAYANYFQVGQNACEVVIDFGYAHDENHVTWASRVVMSPQYAKALLRLLEASLDQHETRYGPVDEP